MSLRSATGGHVVLPGVINVPVGKWNGNWRSALATVTQSDCGGGTVYFGTNMDPEWSYSVARDDVNFPEALGFVPGTLMPKVQFKLGAGTKCDAVSNTTVESVEPVVDTQSNEVVRVDVRGKGGTVAFNQTIV